MKQFIAHITLLVNDYDEAIEFYTKKLEFNLIEDTQLNEMKRWVLIAPKGSTECCLLLAKAATEEQKNRVGNQAGGRVFLFLYTQNFEADYQNLLKHQVKIIREPKEENYGTVAVFEDLYGNRWDLIQPAFPEIK
ncbi:MAG TPA: VOC family protein [Flavisolibacter sp.]|nr:VOC family protein [Flavisolibacter sp.]